MTETCQACNQRPVQDATVCTSCAEDLARALADVTALITRPCRHQWPTPADVKRGAVAGQCLTCHRQPIARFSHGALPSSPFDLPSGLALLGRTRDLGDDLDVARAHQATLTRRDTTHAEANSRVFAPRRGLDRAQNALDAALTIWANVVEAEHPNLPERPARPRRDGTGRGLGNLAGWLLNHVEWIRHYPQGHEAVQQITTAVAAVERTVDSPPEKYYLGPCWQPDETSPTGECTADLYADAQPRNGITGTNVLCPRCLHPHPIEERREWLREHMHDQLATATEASRAAGILGLAVTPERVWQWKSRGRITTHGTRQAGKKALPLYRIGDILDLAIDDPDAARRSA